MLHTHNKTTPLTDALWNVAWPLFLFAAVLSLLLVFSWTILLPRYTRVEVGGVARTSEELERYRNTLTAQIVRNEEQRRELVLAVNDPAYTALNAARDARVTADELLQKFRETASASAEKTDVVHVDRASIEHATGIFMVEGNVRNVGGASMTVLASFISDLRSAPWVQKIEGAKYARFEDDVIGPYSPFSFRITTLP